MAIPVSCSQDCEVVEPLELSKGLHLQLISGGLLGVWGLFSVQRRVKGESWETMPRRYDLETIVRHRLGFLKSLKDHAWSAQTRGDCPWRRDLVMWALAEAALALTRSIVKRKRSHEGLRGGGNTLVKERTPEPLSIIMAPLLRRSWHHAQDLP